MSGDGVVLANSTPAATMTPTGAMAAPSVVDCDSAVAAAHEVIDAQSVVEPEWLQGACSSGGAASVAGVSGMVMPSCDIDACADSVWCEEQTSGARARDIWARATAATSPPKRRSVITTARWAKTPPGTVRRMLNNVGENPTVNPPIGSALELCAPQELCVDGHDHRAGRHEHRADGR